MWSSRLLRGELRDAVTVTMETKGEARALRHGALRGAMLPLVSPEP